MNLGKRIKDRLHLISAELIGLKTVFLQFIMLGPLWIRFDLGWAQLSFLERVDSIIRTLDCCHVLLEGQEFGKHFVHL